MQAAISMVISEWSLKQMLKQRELCEDGPDGNSYVY